MKKSSTVIIAVVAIIFLIIMFFGGSYNSLVSKSEKVDKELANVDVQLERRADLIPNLVSTVKGYASHETEIIDKITTARENLLKANTVEEKGTANDQLTSALNALMVVVENYPDLKSNENFIQLSDELAGTENRIATARRDYNNTVTDYNTTVKRFPTNILASMFGFEKKAYFEVSEGKTEVPKVEF